MTENKINIYQARNYKTQLVRSYPLQKVFYSVADAAINDQYQIAIALKNGDVFYTTENTFQKIYDSRKHDTIEYSSLISKLTFDEDNQLYLCDVGLREIYSIDTQTKETETIIHRNSFSALQTDTFSKMPIYTGINVNNGVISFLSGEYIYDQAADEEIYTYQLVSVSKDGTLCFQLKNIGISMLRRIQIFGVYLAILLFALVLIYSINRTVDLLKKKNSPEKSNVIQLIMLATALSVTLCVSYVIFDNCNNRYVKETGKNLTNTSYRVGEMITVSDMENIDSPDF